MNRIILYVVIIGIGFILSNKKLIPDFFKRKISLFQTLSLFFLLGIMGYKIGADKEIISNLHKIGFQALLVGSLSIVFSIVITFLFFRKKGE